MAEVELTMFSGDKLVLEVPQDNINYILNGLNGHAKVGCKNYTINKLLKEKYDNVCFNADRIESIRYIGGVK